MASFAPTVGRRRPAAGARQGSPGSDRLTLGLPNAQYSESGSSACGEVAPACFWPDSLVAKYDVGGVIGKGASSEVFAAFVRRRPPVLDPPPKPSKTAGVAGRAARSAL